MGSAGPCRSRLRRRGAQPQLAVGVEVSRRKDDVVARFDHQQVWRNVRIELDQVGGGARDEDVVEGLEGQHAERREQLAAALVDEDHLVGGAVAIQFRLRLDRPAAPQGHVGVGEHRQSARDGVAARLHLPGLEVMMPQHRLLDHVKRPGAGRLDLADACGRPEVVGDAVRPAKAGRRDDFLVVDAFAAIAGLDAVFGVPLAPGSARADDRVA